MRSIMEENRRRIYLDYAATTPVDPEVFETMRPYFSEKYGNPSSIHRFGQEGQAAVVEARRRVAEFLNCDPQEVIFTSGATEANNTAIKGLGGNKKLVRGLGGRPHIIVSAFEHDCVLAAAQRLLKDERADVVFLPPSRDGFVEMAELKEAITSNTALVSIMYANNEVGTVQPIAEISGLLREINKNRQQKIYFHTDAAQAVNYLDCDVEKLGVDLMTLSAHKIYGPKGVGALYVKKGTPLEPLLDGGEQEFKLRAGTHNTPGIVGLAAAIKKVKEQQADIGKTEVLRDKLIDGVLAGISHTFLNGARQNRLSNNANFRFDGAEGESIVMALDMEGVAVSTGSACAAKSLKPSHILKAIGLNDMQAHSSVRFSLGRLTQNQEIDYVLEILPGIVERLRNISGNLGQGAVKLPADFGC